MPEQEPARLFVELLDEVARLRGRIASAFAGERGHAGLSELELVVLNAVTGAAQPPTVPQIGRSLGHARQVIQRAATALEGRALVRWIDNPDHKRARRLVATAQGQALKAVANARGLAVAAAVTQGLDPAVLGATVTGLRHVRERIEAWSRDGCD